MTSTDDLSIPVTVRPNVTVDQLKTAVEHHLLALKNVTGGTAGTSPIEIFNEYCRWANMAARDLAPLVAARDIDRLLLTRRHWVLQQIDPTSNIDIGNLVRLEISERTSDLEELSESLKSFVGRWGGAGHLIVPDTNFFLYSECPMDEVNWAVAAELRTYDHYTVVVHIAVVDELDRLKRNQEVGTNARLTLKVLRELFKGARYNVPIAQTHDQARGGLLLDPVGHVRQTDTDSEIIDRTLALTALTGASATLLTFDTGMSFRADAARLPVKLFDRQQKPPSWAKKRTASTGPPQTPGSPAHVPPPAVQP